MLPVQVKEYVAPPPEVSGAPATSLSLAQLKAEGEAKQAALESWCKTAYGEASGSSSSTPTAPTGALSLPCAALVLLLLDRDDASMSHARLLAQMRKQYMYLLLGSASLQGMENLSGSAMFYGLYGFYDEAAWCYWHHTSRH